jgi:hypothetical protein
MKLSQSEQEHILALLTRLYRDIAELETRFNLMIGEGDYRPRIEYFHDAIRAFTSKAPIASDGTSRLNIEWLAYDLQAMRYIQSMPLSPFTPHQELSPHTDVIRKKPNSLSPSPTRPDRETKTRLIELYQRYAILFAALLKLSADNDFHVRTDEANQDVATILNLVAQFEKGSSAAAIADSVNHLEANDIRIMLQRFMESGKHKKTPEVKKILASLKGEIKKKNKTVKDVEKAHMDYGLAQLGLYEAAKDTVKKMAASGMNLVGNFVDKAMAETRREMGR